MYHSPTGQQQNYKSFEQRVQTETVCLCLCFCLCHSFSLPSSSLLIPSLSLSLRMLRERCSREKRPRIANVSTARITRAPADRKLPLIASQTFILHPEYPRLLLYPLPHVLRLLIKSLSIKLNRIPLYHPSFV